MKSTTLIQAMLPQVDGRVLFESFEGLNWQTDQNWITINGSPASSSDVAKDGLKSFIVDSTFPQMYNASEFELAAGWFFDDSAETTGGVKPFLQCRRKGGATLWGLGVDNSVSTTHYCKKVSGVVTVTAVARSTAFHKFGVFRSGSDIVLQIDDVTVSTSVGAGTAVFDRVELGATVYAGTEFGYFDFIQLATSQNLTVHGLEAGQKISLYLEDDTLISTVTVSGTSAVWAIQAEDFPMSAYFKLTRTDGINPRFRSDVLEMWAGDNRAFYEINFDRKVTAQDPMMDVMRTDKEANAGVNEGIFFHAREVNKIAFQGLTEEQRQTVYPWWAYAQESSVYAVAIDSSLTYDGRLAVAPTANDSTITVDSADGLGAGAKILIKRTDNIKMEIKEVASVAGAIVTLTTPLLYTYRVGDFARSIYYHPYCISTDKKIPLRLSNQKIKRWNFIHTFKEKLEGQE